MWRLAHVFHCVMFIFCMMNTITAEDIAASHTKQSLPHVQSVHGQSFRWHLMVSLGTVASMVAAILGCALQPCMANARRSDAIISEEINQQVAGIQAQVRAMAGRVDLLAELLGEVQSLLTKTREGSPLPATDVEGTLPRLDHSPHQARPITPFSVAIKREITPFQLVDVIQPASITPVVKEETTLLSMATRTVTKPSLVGGVGRQASIVADVKAEDGDLSIEAGISNVGKRGDNSIPSQNELEEVIATTPTHSSSFTSVTPLSFTLSTFISLASLTSASSEGCTPPGSPKDYVAIDMEAIESDENILLSAEHFLSAGLANEPQKERREETVVDVENISQLNNVPSEFGVLPTNNKGDCNEPDLSKDKECQQTQMEDVPCYHLHTDVDN